MKWLFISVKMKLWWSNIPTSKTSEFLKNCFSIVKFRSMQFGLADWKHVDFLINHSMSNVLFKGSILNSEVEILHKRNSIKLISYLIQDKWRIVKKIVIFLWWWSIKAKAKPCLSFDGEFNQNYFTVIGNFFDTYHFTRNIFINITKNSTAMFASVLAIHLIAMNLKLPIGKYFI